jgi:aminoglycoside phosphotransferase (APT) family kinase protein
MVQLVWRPGLVIGHNDAAPYNAVWNDDGLVRLMDWDMSGPLVRESDVAWMAFSWVPLHARDVAEAEAEGFSDFGDRRLRLELFLRQFALATMVATSPQRGCSRCCG